jgi:uncharacterized protein YbbC (DUF1343 family)
LALFRSRAHPGLLALAAVVVCPQARSSSKPADRVETGIERYEAMKSEPLRGKRFAIITNQTGVDSEGRRTVDLLARRPGMKLVAIFSPEHGIYGTADADVSDTIDAATHVPVYSLYSATRRPTDAMLRGVDVLIFDIQDAGVRFYTYVTTMAYCLEEAAKRHIEFYVLDRPNPLGGEIVEGPMLDPDKLSFTGYFPMPVRYGMTIGELARMFNHENKIGADLHVIEMQHWQRDQTYNETGLPWIAPSPNLSNLNAAFLYPGIEILQSGGVSVGRGTDTPFEILGAPWIDANALADDLNRRKIPGIVFAPAQFTPAHDWYQGQRCSGVTMKITSRDELRPMRVGLEIADALHRMYPNHFKLAKIVLLLGSQQTVDRLARGEAPADIIAGWSGDLEKFRALRSKYLLYPSQLH